MSTPGNMKTNPRSFIFIVLIAAQGTFAFPNLFGYFMDDKAAANGKVEETEGLNHFHEPWLFATGLGVGKPYDYLDKEGNIQGFHRDLIEEICKEADQQCYIIFDDYRNCYLHEDSGRPTTGIGIQSRWYDGCVGYFKTLERVPLFTFSVPLFEANSPLGKFFVVNGNPSGFDPADVTGKRIGFLSGWSTHAQCISREGRVGNIDSLAPGNKIYLKDVPSLVALLRNKELDAIFISAKSLPGHVQDLVTIGPGITCGSEQRDVSLHTMFKKGSPAVEWFNAAFERIKENGQYYKICQSAEPKHGEAVTCVV